MALDQRFEVLTAVEYAKHEHAVLLDRKSDRNAPTPGRGPKAGSKVLP